MNARKMMGMAVAAMLLAVLGLTAGAGAGEWVIEKELGLYGYLDQHSIPGWGNAGCGPTAAVNSFVYLENKYPGIYDRSLIPDTNQNGVRDLAELVGVAQTLGGPGYMNTIANNTTWDDDFIWGKMTYIEQKVPGMTVYQAQDYWNWTQHTKPAWVQSAWPQWEFLYNELVDCEDVEILIDWSDGGHYVTLSSFHWNDADNDLIIDNAENAWIDFVDPWTGAYGTASIWQSSYGGCIETNYATGSWISMGVSESPIPEPATMTLLALGFALSLSKGGLALIRRRR